MCKYLYLCLYIVFFQALFSAPVLARDDLDLRPLIESGDYVSVAKAIKDGADVNYQGKDDSEGMYAEFAPINIAVVKNQYDIAELLLKNGANPNIYYSRGISPLIDAVLKHNLDMVKLLIKYKADLDQTDGYGQTPLIFASKEGNLKIVKILVENGANITHQDSIELTAHDYARRYKHDDIGDYFVEKLWNRG